MSDYERGLYRGKRVFSEADNEWADKPVDEPLPPLSAWFRKLHKMPALQEDADSCVASEAEKKQNPESAF